MKKKELKASSIVLVQDGAKILAVSRKEDPTKWGLPGGKSEDSESEISTAAREFVEETDSPISNLRLLEKIEHGDFIVSLFSGQLIGDIAPHTNTEGCQVDWLSPEDFAKKAMNVYNSAIFNRYLEVTAE